MDFESQKIYGIVCGMPRCGTRNFASLLNKNRSIAIQGEIPADLLKKSLELVLESDAAYKATKYLPIWQARRYAAMSTAIAIFSKGNPVQRPKALMHGFKLPNIEFEYELLNDTLSPSVDRIQYMYCIRNITDCYLSLAAMPWFSRSLENFVTRYIRSLRTIAEIKEKRSWKGASLGVSIFNLDSFIAEENKAQWVSDKLFRPLGLDISAARSANYLETMGYINSTKQATGKDRATDLPVEVLRYFKAERARIGRALEQFNRVFEEGLTLNF